MAEIPLGNLKRRLFDNLQRPNDFFDDHDNQKQPCKYEQNNGCGQLAF